MSHELFRVDSWAMVLLGQRLAPIGYHHVAEMTPVLQLREELARTRKEIRELVYEMPSHPEFLKAYCPADEPA